MKYPFDKEPGSGLILVTVKVVGQKYMFLEQKLHFVTKE